MLFLLTGDKYLVSASRDRLIHIFDAANGYTHLQALSDHSSSVCSVKLIPIVDGMLMISCSNDKVCIIAVTQICAGDECVHRVVLQRRILELC